MYQIYQIKSGDTIEQIANNLGISPNKLRELNGLLENSKLRVGGYLIIPVNNQEGYQTYIIKQGDTLYSIATSYGVDYKTLARINGLKDNEYIYPNQEIMIPMNGRTYVTKEGDTISFILSSTGITIDELLNKNNNIYLLEDQIIKY